MYCSGLTKGFCVWVDTKKQGLIYAGDDGVLDRVMAAWRDQQVWAFLLDFRLPDSDPAARGLGLPGNPFCVPYNPLMHAFPAPFLF